MPIAVVCSACSSRLNAPDAAAGKSVKCPTCKAALTVPDPASAPAFEVVDEATPPKKSTAAKPQAAVVEVDDDEEEKPRRKKAVDGKEDDGEKPRTKKKRVAAESGNMARNIIGAVVLVAALGIAGFVWWDRSRDKGDNNGSADGGVPTGGSSGPGGTPPGQTPPKGVTPGAGSTPGSTPKSATERYTYTATNRFQLSFPAKPVKSGYSEGAFRKRNLSGEEMEGVRDRISYYSWYVDYPANSSVEEKEKLYGDLFKGFTALIHGFKGSDRTKRVIAGKEWDQVTYKGVPDIKYGTIPTKVAITFDTGTSFYAVMVSRVDGEPPADVMNEFFESLKFLP